MLHAHIIIMKSVILCLQQSYSVIIHKQKLHEETQS